MYALSSKNDGVQVVPEQLTAAAMPLRTARMLKVRQILRRPKNGYPVIILPPRHECEMIHPDQK
jgi:hypothetical protein